MTVMLTVWAALRRVPLWAWAVVGLVAAGAWYGHTQRLAGRAEVQAKWDAAVERGAAQAAAREQDWRNSIYHLAYAAEKRRLEREQETERTIADLRAGTLRLRPRFTCPAVPGDSTASGESVPADAGGLQLADVEFLLREAERADRAADERNQCIDSYNALRK